MCQLNVTQNCRRKALQPILALNPYNNNWTIKARVSSKTPLRNNSRTGQPYNLFSITLVDEQVRTRKLSHETVRLSCHWLDLVSLSLDDLRSTNLCVIASGW